MSDALSWSANNNDQQNTHNSDYLMETIPELLDIYELPEFMFTIHFYIIEFYQYKYPSLMSNLSLNHVKEVIFADQVLIFLILQCVKTK